MNTLSIFRRMEWYDFAALVISVALVAMVWWGNSEPRGLTQAEAVYTCRHVGEHLVCSIALPDETSIEVIGHAWQINNEFLQIRAKYRSDHKVHLVFIPADGRVM